MVNITVNLDKRKAKKDGTYPICFGIYHTGKSTTRSSKIYIKENQWNENSKSVRKSHPNSFELNKLLKSKLAELQSNLFCPCTVSQEFVTSHGWRICRLDSNK